MKLTKEEQIQANANHSLALIRKERAKIFAEEGHIPLSPFATKINKINSDSVVCVCGETFCSQNETIQTQIIKMREGKKQFNEGKLQ